MKRRTFLKMPALGTTLSIAATKSKQINKPVEKTPAVNDISSDIVVLATAYLPLSIDQENLNLKEVEEKFMFFFGHLDPSLRKGLRLLLRLLNVVAYMRFGRSFKYLSRTQKEKLLKIFANSRLGPARNLLQVIRMMTFVGLYSTGAGFQVTGYSPACPPPENIRIPSWIQEGAR